MSPVVDPDAAGDVEDTATGGSKQTQGDKKHEDKQTSALFHVVPEIQEHVDMRESYRDVSTVTC